jgi:hypothetical protein
MRARERRLREHAVRADEHGIRRKLWECGARSMGLQCVREGV